MDVFSALFIFVDHTKISDVKKCGVSGPPAEIAVLRASALRVVFPAHRKVGAAIDRPVIPIADHRAFTRGTAKVRNQESRLVGFFRQGVGRKREVEHGHSMHPKTAVVHARVPSDLDGDAICVKFPIGLRQLASSHGSAVNHVASGPAFLHQLAREGERIRRDQFDIASPGLQPGGPVHVVEVSELCLDVIQATGGLNMLVIRAALEDDVPFRRGRSAFRVIRHLIRRQNPRPVEDFGVPVQFVNDAVFLQLGRANGRFPL